MMSSARPSWIRAFKVLHHDQGESFPFSVRMLSLMMKSVQYFYLQTLVLQVKSDSLFLHRTSVAPSRIALDELTKPPLTA